MNYVLQSLALLGGVAPTSALAERGIRPPQVDDLVRRGDILRVRRGWVALPESPADVVRAVRVGGHLSCVSALAHHKVWCIADRNLHVRVARNAGNLSSPGDRRVPLGRPEHFGVRLHRSIPGLDAKEAAVDPIELALIHSTVCQPPMEALVSLDSALNMALTDVSTLSSLFDLLPKRYRKLLERVDPSCQSGLETKARLSLRRYRIRHRTQVTIAGVGIVDILVGDRLVIELDGFGFHGGRHSFENDRRRDLELVRRGYIVVRVSYAQVMDDWESIVGVIRELVARRDHHWPAFFLRGQV